MMQKYLFPTLLFLWAAPAALAAQRPPEKLALASAMPHDVADAARLPPILREGVPGGVQDTLRHTARIRPLRIAKWTVLVAAAGAGIYGFTEDDAAGDGLRQLELLCRDQQFRCAARTETGAYADPEFAALDRKVRRHDRRSHDALLASQIGIAASVALFLIDLGNSSRPDDIPWVPGGFQVERVGSRVELSLRLPDPLAPAW